MGVELRLQEEIPNSNDIRENENQELNNNPTKLNSEIIRIKNPEKQKTSKCKKYSLILLILILIAIILVLLFIIYQIHEKKEPKNSNTQITIEKLDNIEYKLDSEYIDFNPTKVFKKIKKFSDPGTIRKFPLEKTTDTKCLDGSEYSVYYSPGYDSGENKILIGFEGQSWCYDRNVEKIPEICQQRTNNFYGSSKTWKNEYNYEENFYSGDPTTNPQFYNWNRYIIPYCDGTGNQGHIERPLNVKDIFGNESDNDLYFRGYKNTVEAFKFIFQHIDLNKLDLVVISGCSSGAWSAFQWMGIIEDYLEKVSPKAKLLGIMSGGYFIDFKSVKTNDNDFLIKTKNMYSFANKESPAVNRKCLKDYKEQPYLCLFPDVLLNYIKSPILMYQFQYDSWQIWAVLEEFCVNDEKSMRKCNQKQREKIIELREYSMKKLRQEVVKKKNLSLFSPACVNHCFHSSERKTRDFVVKNYNVNEVMTEFINTKGSKQIVLIDDVDWPNNFGCANQ